MVTQATLPTGDIFGALGMGLVAGITLSTVDMIRDFSRPRYQREYEPRVERRRVRREPLPLRRGVYRPPFQEHFPSYRRYW